MVSFTSIWGNKNWLRCMEHECKFTFHKDDEEGMKDHALFHQLGAETYKAYKNPK